MAQLNLSYSGTAKLNLGYGVRPTGHLNLAYNGKLNLAYGRAPQPTYQAPYAETGKLMLSYSAQGKLGLAYRPPPNVPGKLNLEYNGKLNLAYTKTQPSTSGPCRSGPSGKINLGYSPKGKLQLGYQTPRPVEGKLNFQYTTPGKMTISYNRKEGKENVPVNSASPSNVSKLPVKPLTSAPPVNASLSNAPAPVKREVFVDVATLANSGDGSVENVGIKLDAPIQCPDCRQKMVSEAALKIHWRFIHDPNRHQED